MGADTPHDDYVSHENAWQRVRDVLNGEDSVKGRGITYLPKLSGQDQAEYEAYVNRAEFHEATGRTLDGLSGAVFRKDPVVTFPVERFNEVLEGLTPLKTPFVTFAKGVVRETIGLGRYGVLVDVPQEGGEPFAQGYTTERIINWRTAIINGEKKLVLVVLAETRHEVDANDPFKTNPVDRWRVLSLGTLPDDQSGRLVYIQTVWEQVKGGAGTAGSLGIVEGPLVPTRAGEPLDFIPFTFFGPFELSVDVQRSPILGLVNVNLSHYRTSADIEHGAHFTALPTAWIAGQVRNDGDTLRIGSAVAWQLETGAQAGYLEYTGQGLESLEKRLERKEQHMAVLGARLLEDQKKAAEAAETVALRHRGENSLLASIADTCSRGLAQVLGRMIWWLGHESLDAVNVGLNKDFFEKALAPAEVVQLAAAWQQGAIGGQVLFYNLKDGERLPPNFTLEDWQQDLEQNGPTAIALAFNEDE